MQDDMGRVERGLRLVAGILVGGLGAFLAAVTFAIPAWLGVTSTGFFLGVGGFLLLLGLITMVSGATGSHPEEFLPWVGSY